MGKKTVLGVDIGTNTIKILELKVSGKKISVLNLAQQNIAELAVEDKAPEEKKQIFVNTLKTLLNKQKFKTKQAAVSISGSSVIVRFVKFPKMTPQELEKTLEFEAEPHIPFNIQEVDIDTQIIEDVEEDGQQKMETVLVASKKETIQEKLAIVEAAGLKPAIIDVDAFALENAYEQLHPDTENMVILVNIGASTTNISIVENGISKVVRDLYVAGNNMTRAIQNTMRIPLPEAEDLKIKFGLSGGIDGVETAESDSQLFATGTNMAVQIYEIIYPIIKELNSEIQRSIDYFTGQQTASDINIEKIILAGGSSKLLGLTEMIQNELKLPVEVFSPLSEADTKLYKGNDDLNSPALAVVTGLAIRSKGDYK